MTALQAWDILALVPVIEGAGGCLSGLDGASPLAARDLVACGDARWHCEVLALLAS